jgi:hypothetical protein
MNKQTKKNLLGKPVQKLCILLFTQRSNLLKFGHLNFDGRNFLLNILNLTDRELPLNQAFDSLVRLSVFGEPLEWDVHV